MPAAVPRTHTTAVSARTLYQLGQEYKKTGAQCEKTHSTFAERGLTAQLFSWAGILNHQEWSDCDPGLTLPLRTGVFTPKKYFSIDRVFRNETLDATHLAEFHQASRAPPRAYSQQLNVND